MNPRFSVRELAEAILIAAILTSPLWLPAIIENFN